MLVWKPFPRLSMLLSQICPILKSDNINTLVIKFLQVMCYLTYNLSYSALYTHAITRKYILLTINIIIAIIIIRAGLYIIYYHNFCTSNTQEHTCWLLVLFLGRNPNNYQQNTAFAHFWTIAVFASSHVNFQIKFWS